MTIRGGSRRLKLQDEMIMNKDFGALKRPSYFNVGVES
jgi:hypothetical protein